MHSDKVSEFLSCSRASTAVVVLTWRRTKSPAGDLLLTISSNGAIYAGPASKPKRGVACYMRAASFMPCG